MDDDKHPSQGSGGPSPDDDIPPKPPDLIAKIKWILVYGKRHRGLVIVAFLIASAGWIVSMPSGLTFLRTLTDSLIHIRIQRTVIDLRPHFREAQEALLQSGPGAFAGVEKEIDVILKLDPRNGHALYYSGEVKRLKNRSLFTDKACVIPERLAEHPEGLDTYEKDFFRYLDIERMLPKSETTGDYSAETCYNRASGFCPQRTAWINHLLANDLFEEAKLSTDSVVKAAKLHWALEHAKTAADLYRDPNQNEGFIQCKPTTVVISEAKTALK